MLSISLIGNSGVATSYYEKDDYYAGNGENPAAQGQWYGKATEALGLSGAVDKEKFKSLMEGTLPDGSTLGRMRDGERQHTPGWDLTFSAPKSVSLMYEIAGDKRVLEAHQKAVKDAVGWLEQSTSVRKGPQGRSIEETGNLAVALFDHNANRNQDPQLHTHAVILNITQSNDRFQSIHSRPFFQQKMAGGNVYRAALAQELQKAGYQIEQTHTDGRFEISGIEPKILEVFSTRRKDIEADMKARGTEGAEAAKQSALRTRERKENLDPSVLADVWKARAYTLGFEAEKHIARTPEQAPITEWAEKRAALTSAVSRLSEQEAVFTQAKLMGQVLADGMGKLTVKDAERLIQNDHQDGQLVAARIGQQKAWTTKEANKQEQRIHLTIDAGKNAVDALFSAKQIDRELKDTTLGDGQKQALHLMLGSRDQFVGVLGRPGTGKTFMLDKARELYERQGFTMVGMASNAEAAGQLSESAGMEAKTLARHLIEAGKEVHRRRTELTPAQRLEERADMRQVWVVDEASQVNNRDLARLSSMAKSLGARVAFIGDPQQLGAIEAGKPFTRMLDTGLRHVELDDIRRQSKDEHISAIRSVIAGDVAGAMRTLEKHTHEIADESKRLDDIVDRWSKLDNRDSALVITSRQDTKNALNERMRDILRQEGKLQDEQKTEQLTSVFSCRADLKLASTYTAGDTVRFNQNAKSIQVKNGEYWRVAETDARTNTVRIERNGESREWDPRKVGTGLQSGVQLFRTREATIASGETIVWSRNNAELGLRNGQRLTVDNCGEKSMTVRTEDGRQVALDLSQTDHRHWEHGYASTIYKSQGKTAQEVLVHAPTQDSQLLSQKAFLVAVSRQKDDITIITDDREKLERSIKNNLGDKTSALEAQEDWKAWEKASEAGEAAGRETGQTDQTQDFWKDYEAIIQKTEQKTPIDQGPPDQKLPPPEAYDEGVSAPLPDQEIPPPGDYDERASAPLPGQEITLPGDFDERVSAPLPDQEIPPPGDYDEWASAPPPDQEIPPPGVYDERDPAVSPDQEVLPSLEREGR